MDSKRLLIAALLSMAVLILWQRIFPPPKPVRPVSEPAGQETPATTEESAMNGEPATSSAGEAPAPVEERGEIDSEVPAAPEQEAPAPTAMEPPPVEPVGASSQESIVLENEWVRAEFSNRGGELRSWQLKNHANAEGEPVDMVRRRAGGAYVFAFVDSEGDPLEVADRLFAVQRDGAQGVVFRYAGPEGVARKRFTLRSDGLLEIEASLSGSRRWGLMVGPGIRNPSTGEAKNRFARRSAAYSTGEKVSLSDPNRTDSPVEVSAAEVSWVGLEDNYFLAAVVPSERLDAILLRPLLGRSEGDAAPVFEAFDKDEEDQEGVREMEVVLVPAEDRFEGVAFLGAKQYDRLAALPYGLEKAVNFGVFGILARPLLWCLRWIHDHLVANYGWAIILLTVLLRLLLFPLNHKSIVSMQKMQRLNPKIQSIRHKYRSKLKDKQGRPNRTAQAEMNQKIMELYKQEGVNPAAGCLPMLLQMPVLFAFYRLLTVAIEIRHSPWVGWVRDLSAPDPFYVLPVVMGVSMLVQQRVSPQAGDPMQRKMMMLMPVMFTVFFLGFPTGLVLYWLTNNILAIVQQLGYQRWRDARTESVGDG